MMEVIATICLISLAGTLCFLVLTVLFIVIGTLIMVVLGTILFASHFICAQPLEVSDGKL